MAKKARCSFGPWHPFGTLKARQADIDVLDSPSFTCAAAGRRLGSLNTSPLDATRG